MTGALSILAVDDEVPSLDELAFLLRACELVASVTLATSALGALRLLAERRFDLLLVDVAMPGLDGLGLAQVLDRFATPPAVAFVTAYEGHALRAFDVGAVGYLLKPIDRQRLERLLSRVVHAVGGQQDAADLEILSLEHAGRTRLASRDEVVLVESAGDYVRVHLRDGSSHLLRVPISALDQAWSDHGFVRVHRGFLVPLRAISELRTEETGAAVVAAGRVIPVSRRHLRELRDRLVGHARQHAR